MGKIITKFDYGKDFFKVNPSFEFINEFREIKKKHKKEYSDILWNIAILVDDSGSNPYSNIPFEERKTLITEDAKDNGKEFSFEGLDDAIKKYQDLCETDSERAYRILKDSFYKRTKFIDEYDVKLDTIETLDKLMMNTPKILNELRSLKDIVDSEKEDGRLKGGGEESLSDSGAI
jgi:hypothetical protein